MQAFLYPIEAQTSHSDEQPSIVKMDEEDGTSLSNTADMPITPPNNTPLIPDAFVQAANNAHEINLIEANKPKEEKVEPQITDAVTTPKAGRTGVEVDEDGANSPNPIISATCVSAATRGGCTRDRASGDKVHRSLATCGRQAGDSTARWACGRDRLLPPGCRLERRR